MFGSILRWRAGAGPGFYLALIPTVSSHQIHSFSTAFFTGKPLCDIKPTVDTPSVVVLLVGVVELGTGFLLLGVAGLLLWSYRQLRPQDDLIRAVKTLEIDVDDLEKRYKKVRGQKARAAKEEPAEDVDPELADLDPEVRALFPS